LAVYLVWLFNRIERSLVPVALMALGSLARNSVNDGGSNVALTDKIVKDAGGK